MLVLFEKTVLYTVDTSILTEYFDFESTKDTEELSEDTLVDLLSEIPESELIDYCDDIGEVKIVHK